MINVRLMNPDTAFVPQDDRQTARDAYFYDLLLPGVLDRISEGDALVRSVAATALLSPLQDAESIHYRQSALRDCIHNPCFVRSLYLLASETLAAQQREDLRFSYSQSVSRQFQSCLLQLSLFIESLRSLREFMESNSRGFSSPAFCGLSERVAENFDDAFFTEADALMEEFNFPSGMLIGAKLSGIGRICEMRLLSERRCPGSIKNSEGFYRIQSDDEIGVSDFVHRRETVKCEANRTLLRAILHMTDFFKSLHAELAFYIACLNLIDRLAEKSVAFCVPEISEGRAGAGLVELNIALGKEEITGNDFDLLKSRLCVITGADQGGKTSFMISIGQAQVLMQCGMPVAAREFRAPIAAGVFTHFQKEEDRTMRNGKLNEELVRMSRIVDQIRPSSLMLFDESFCSTNEQEGSRIALDITHALLVNHIDVFSVTHLYAYAKTLYDEAKPEYAFLCAQRLDNGMRTKRIIPGKPLSTSFGLDIYHEIFEGR